MGPRSTMAPGHSSARPAELTIAFARENALTARSRTAARSIRCRLPAFASSDPQLLHGDSVPVCCSLHS